MDVDSGFGRQDLAGGFLVPAGHVEAEYYVEKRSRFIGQVWRVEGEGEARARIEEARARFHGTQTHCWCYALREGNVRRYADGGEPQGTAGQPMLNVLVKEGVTDAVCVVTRYFGGIHLGAGGLARAYGGTAKLALDAAGIRLMRLWAVLAVPCPYPLYERVRLLAEKGGGAVESADFGADVALTLLLPSENASAFQAAVTELSGGTVAVLAKGEQFRPGPAMGVKTAL